MALLIVGATVRVDDREVTVTEFDPDATALLKKVNQFDDDPAAGDVQVTSGMKAKCGGDESGTLWTNMTYKFCGPGRRRG